MKDFSNLIHLEIELEDLLEWLKNRVRTDKLSLVDGDATIDVAPLWTEASAKLRQLVQRTEQVTTTGGPLLGATTTPPDLAAADIGNLQSRVAALEQTTRTMGDLLLRILALENKVAALEMAGTFRPLQPCAPWPSPGTPQPGGGFPGVEPAPIQPPWQPWQPWHPNTQPFWQIPPSTCGGYSTAQPEGTP